MPAPPVVRAFCPRPETPSHGPKWTVLGETPALLDGRLALTVPRGEVFGLVGPNGAGMRKGQTNYSPRRQAGCSSSGKTRRFY